MRTFVAGVMYENRDVTAQELHLGESLTLLREPDNAHDVNAIRVQREEGQPIGFVPKEMAAWLAPFIDAHQMQLIAAVTELHIEPVTLHVRVQIEFAVPQTWAELSPRQAEPSPPPEYAIDRTQTGLYVLLNCNVDQFQTARDILTGGGYEIQRDGYCIRPSSKGRFFEWYLKLDPALAERDAADISDLLKRRMGAAGDGQQAHAVEELRRKYQQEFNALQSRLTQAQTEQRIAREQNSKAAAQKQAEIDQLQINIEHKEAELKNLKGRVQNSAAVLQALANRQPVISADYAEVLLDVVADRLTPRLSLDVIARLFPDRIVVLDSAYAAADDSAEFRERSKLFGLLWKLVNEYRAMLLDGAGDTEARKVFGASYAAVESETAASNAHAKRRHTFAYGGRPIVMEKHLKIGVKDSAHGTIRVHFEWLAGEKKIVVGYCGPHLPLR